MTKGRHIPIIDIPTTAVDGEPLLWTPVDRSFRVATGAWPLATWNPQPIRKTANEIVNNSDVIQDDNHLFFAIGANEVWVAEFVLFATSASFTPDMDVAITAPAGAAVVYAAYGARAADAVMSNFGPATASGTELGPMGVGSVTGMVRINVSVANGATAGNVRLRWAQNVATATDLTLLAGSYCLPRRAA